MKLIWLLLRFALFIFTWKCVRCYNVDTDYPLVFQGPPNSYFGFSVSLMKRNNISWLIVGAPKANSTNFQELKEPGEIFKCPINLQGNNDCSVLQLDPRGNDVNHVDREKMYKDRKEYGWLGASLDTTDYNDGRIVACGHLWVNQYYQGWYLVNGVCYTIDGDFSEMSFEKLTPLISKSDQIMLNQDYKYAYSQMGISAHFVKDSDSLLLGAPGIQDWRGSSVFLSRTHSGIVQKRSLGGSLRTYGTITVPNVVSNVDYTAYFGYAVTSGRFSENKKIQYAIGAPRDKYRGMVYIVEIKNGMYDVKVDKKGEQMGEYFGGSVCAVDFNNDGLDDLLVGAPMHSKAVDEGKVYVFQNEGSIHLQLVGQGLMGSSVPKARFGTTIINIGDINMDGYQDVAIGAPFEDGRGAVYIYHGGVDGLKSHFQQKIVAAVVGNKAKGFGMSISRGLDVDNNKYPDIVIGSFNSDQAFLFRSRPLIYLKGTISSSVLQLDMEKKNCLFNGNKYSCFQERICFTYTGQHVPLTIRIKTKFEIDLLKGNLTRISIKHSKDQLINKIEEEVKLTKDVKQCNELEILALTEPTDYITPIQMKMTYEMIPDPISFKKSFCSTCPLVDKPEKNQTITTVLFMKHCGNDDKCESDLSLKAHFKDLDLNSEFVIGSKNRLVLHLDVFNAGEKAYATRVILSVPKWMTVDQIPPICEFNNKDQIIPRLVCLVANPLNNNTSISLDLNLNVQNIPVKNGVLVINATAISDSSEDEAKRSDNNVLLTVPVKVQADIAVIGSTINDQVFYYHDDKGKIQDGATANFSHLYEIFNYGPSRMATINIEIRYPSPLYEGQPNVIQISSIDKRNGYKGAVFGSCEGDIAPVSPTPPDQSASLEPEARRRREVDADYNDINNNTRPSDELKPKEYFYMNCSTFPCKTLTCTVGPFDKETGASLMITFMTSLPKLRPLMGKLDSAVVMSEAYVWVPNLTEDIQPVGHKPDQTYVTTEVKPGGPPLPKEIASWIIPVSVVGGLLLLVLIVAGLVKMGFFRRQAKEDMEKLKNTSQSNLAPESEHLNS